MKAKVCGIKDEKTLNYITTHPCCPDYIGFICNYKKSKRYIDINTLKKILKIDKNKSSYVAVLVKPSENELEEILVGALPLGSLPGAMHMEQEISFKNSGDILVMMSDGLPEAENANREMVGYERTEEKIRDLADKSAEEIKNGLVDLCNNWLKDNAELQDDMTFVIIKKK